MLEEECGQAEGTGCAGPLVSGGSLWESSEALCLGAKVLKGHQG